MPCPLSRDKVVPGCAFPANRLSFRLSANPRNRTIPDPDSQPVGFECEEFPGSEIGFFPAHDPCRARTTKSTRRTDLASTLQNALRQRKHQCVPAVSESRTRATWHVIENMCHNSTLPSESRTAEMSGCTTSGRRKQPEYCDMCICM